MYGIFSGRSAAIVLGVVCVAVAVAGCDSDATTTGIKQQQNGMTDGESKVSFLESALPDRVRGERPMLRYRVDAARSRIWVLTQAGVELYEASTGEQVAEVPLPGWIWVGEKFSCVPDLAIGPGGEAIVSSNVVPTLWRIDPVTLAVAKHELVLDDDTGRDFGFTGLVYSAKQGAYLAISAFQGTLWRIDPLFRRAQNIPLSEPLPHACGLAIRPPEPEQRASRFMGLCVRADQADWIVSLAPDQRSGYVRQGHCGG